MVDRRDVDVAVFVRAAAMHREAAGVLGMRRSTMPMLPRCLNTATRNR